ncbi:MAG: thioredoxin [Actinomycetes bacterium]
MGATKTVTDASFADDVLMSEKVVVVDFWAEWCGPCKLVAPILEEIASGNDNIVIAKLNVDENPQTSASYGITSIPTMNVYKGGQIVKTIIGAKPKAALLADLAPYL